MSKILIVEDEDAIRRVLKKVLSDEYPKSIIDEAIDGVDAVVDDVEFRLQPKLGRQQRRFHRGTVAGRLLHVHRVLQPVVFVGFVFEHPDRLGRRRFEGGDAHGT